MHRNRLWYEDFCTETLMQKEEETCEYVGGGWRKQYLQRPQHPSSIQHRVWHEVGDQSGGKIGTWYPLSRTIIMSMLSANFGKNKQFPWASPGGDQTVFVEWISWIPGVSALVRSFHLSCLSGRSRWGERSFVRVEYFNQPKQRLFGIGVSISIIGLRVSILNLSLAT